MIRGLDYCQWLALTDRGLASGNAIERRQDAPYYGIWCDPIGRNILSYCEGDVTLQTAENDVEFVEAVREMVRWNTENGHWIGIDPGWPEHDTTKAYVARFESLGLADLLH